MKIFLRNYFLFFVLMLAGGALFGQVPVLNYSPTTIPVTVGTSVGTISPNTTNTVGSYAALTNWAATVVTGAQSGGLAYDPVIGGLYGDEYAYGQLDKITLTAAVTELSNSITYFPSNTGYSIAVDADGTVYFCDNAAATPKIEEFSASNGYATPIATLSGFTAPKGIAIDASNNLYVVDATDGGDGDGIIYKFALGATTFASGTAIISNLNNPFGIAFKGNDIYVTAYGSKVGKQGIVEIAGGLTGSTTVTTFVAETTKNSVPFKTPRNLTFDANGNLFVCDFGNSTIERITPAGVLTTPFSTNINTTGPNQIAFDPNGNLYLGDLSGYYKKSVVTYYTIVSGVLPTGLTFNTVTGVITGTPTANSGTNPVVIAATNGSGTSSMQSLTFNFPAVAPTVSYATTTPTPPYTGTNTFYQGVAAPGTIIPTSTNVKASGGFAILPTLPAGLSFDLNTGAITGTPTITSPSTSYTVTVTGPTGLTGTTSFNLSVVLPAAPLLSYTATPYTLATGASTSTISITDGTGGGAVTSTYTFAISSGALPAGITFSNITGAFTCTPTAAGTVTGTVTASNAGGTSTANITITVADPPALSYTPSPYTAAQNIAFAFSPTITGGSPTSYVLTSGILPTGITFNTTTGAFGGTSTTLFAAVTFTVTATNAANLSTTVTAKVRCLAAQPFTYTGPNTYIQNSGAITPLNPSATITNASISPALPAGLSMTTAGVISGSPTSTSPTTSYTVTANTANGSINYATVSITVNAPAAPNISYSPSSYTFTVGTGGTTSAIANMGGVATYSIDPLSPPLPSYLTFNSTTGVFTCSTSGVVTPAVGYIVDATNVTATVSTTVNITIANPLPPSLSYTGTPYVLATGSATSTITITDAVGAGAVSSNYTFTITSGALPAGITFSNTTGAFTCLPTAVGTVTGTVTASNAGGPSTANITINVANPPAFSYTPSPYTATQNLAFTFLPTVTGGSPTGYVLNSGALPSGVTFDTTTGAFSGTSAATGTVTYSITATNAAGLSTTVSAILKCVVTQPFTYTGPNSYYVNSGPITALSPTPTTISGATINPALPTGLSISATGVISGSPTAVSAATTYTVTATTANGSTSTGTVSIAVVIPPPPALSFSPAFRSYIAGNTIAAFSVINSGGPIVGSYSITSGVLPAGLVFNAATGTISGTPTTVTPATAITVSGTNAGGTSSAKITIAVNSLPPVINYTPSSYTFTLANPIPTTITPNSTGGAVASGPGYGTPTQILTSTTVSTPWGLAVDGGGNLYVADNGNNNVIKYTPAGVSSPFVTITAPVGIAFDSSGNAYVLTANALTIYNSSGGVITPTTPFTGISGGTGIFIDPSNNIYIANSTSNNVTEYPITGGSGTVLFTAATGNNYFVTGGVAVDGTGNVYVGDKKYVDIYSYANAYLTGARYYTGVTNNYQINVDGSNNIYTADNTKMVISAGSTVLSVPFNAARGVVTDASGNIYVADYGANIIYKYAPNSGYYLSGGPLPAGLTFSNSTGQFSGTPGTSFPAATYTVTAYNSSGSGSTTITFSCNPASLPVINYTPSAYVFAQNVASPVITPNSTGGTIPNLQGYNLSAASIIMSSPNLNNPWGSAVDKSDNFYVANYTGNSIVKYSTSGVITASYITITNPIGIAFDSSGNAYVLTANALTVYNSSGGLVSPAPSFTGITGATGIFIDPSNNIFIANSTGNTIKKYPTTGGAGTTVLTATASGNRVTGGVAVDGSFNIYVSDSYNGTIDEYSSTSAYTSATYVTGIATTDSKHYQLNLDGSNELEDADNTYADMLQNGSTAYLGIYTFSNVRGIVTDSNGVLYVTDYASNTVYRFVPNSGYYLSGGPLPNGLFFNNATGQFYGTPTTTFPTTTYKVVGWNTTGSSTTNVTLTCLLPYNWTGATSTDWNTTGNWSGGAIPGPTDNAYIGVSPGSSYSYTVLPTIPTGTTINVGSVIMGTQDAPPVAANAIAAGVIVNGTLNATSTITYQADNMSATHSGFVASLSGAGTITAGNIVVNANYNTGAAYNLTMTSSVANLTIPDGITLTTTRSGGRNYNSTFNITGGTVTLNGIVTTNNGTANNTSTFGVSNATLLLTNPAALSGISTTGTNTITFNGTGATVNYSGTLASYTGSTIAQTFYTGTVANITAGVSYQNIIFSGTGGKIPNTGGGTLTIGGNFTNNMTNDATNNITLTATPVAFTGTSPFLYGGPGATAANPSNSGNGTIFSNVSFSGVGTATMSTGVFHVASTGLLTLSGTNTATILSVASTANLCLNSDIYGSANVGAMTGPSITGSVDVQRYISGGKAAFRGYRVLSSPVNAGSNYTTIDYLLKSCYVTATTGASKGFDGGFNPSLYLFRENLPVSNSSFITGNFRGINDRTASPSYTMDIDGSGFHIPEGNGYLFFFRGDRSVASFSAETTTSYVPTATTLTATGTLNQGNVTVSNWYNGSGLLYSTTSGPTGVEGFNLVGNPYASSIDWDKSTANGGTGIVTTNVNPFIYIIDPVSRNYNVYKAGNSGVGNIAIANSNIISSGQGFFVVANSTRATMTFKESGKSTTQVSNASRNLFMGVPPLAATIPTMHLVVSADSVIMDGTIITFDNNTQTQFLQNIDAPHRPGTGLVTLAARSTDSIPLAYYTLPFPKQSQVIPLNVFATANGTYQLNMATIQYIPQVYDVWLKDEHLNDSLDMKHNPNYSFDVSMADTSTFGKNRFKLIIRENPALMVHLLNFTASKITGGDQVVWTTENEQNYTNFAVQRSTDGGKTFNVLDGVTSSAQGTYSYLDKTPVNGANSYRLLMTDLNGTVTYSNVVTIMYANTNNQIATNGMLVYPNPTVGVVNLAINSNQAVTTGATTGLNPAYSIEIVNNLGAIIKTATSTSANWQTDVSALLPGTYFIQVIDTNQHKVVGKTAFVRL